MKKNIIVAMATVVILAFTSQFSTAGSITDTYTAGDTLTTTTLDNIKSAVNDNNAASRFYGDGSAGSLIVSGSVSWQFVPPTGNNLNFTDLTITAGSRFTVPAGTTIRCTGTFTNNGTIIVLDSNNLGTYRISSLSFAGFRAPGRGDANSVAGMPEGHTALGVSLVGGFPGIAISKTVAASSFNNFTRGGGGGSSSGDLNGGNGGGLVKIYCQGAIINNGTISANGDGFFTSGGGGGGIVVLASSTSVDNSAGIIEANGGAGGNSNITTGASAGGGGGIIVMAAPAIANLGTTSVTGGAAGTGGTTLTTPVHSAGGGGGASGGNGGRGGNIGADNVAAVADKGRDGYVLEITANPARMM